MLLPFWDGLVVTNHFDAECSQLADRHYSRRTPGARQFLCELGVSRFCAIARWSGFRLRFRRSGDAVGRSEGLQLCDFSRCDIFATGV